MRAVIQRVRWAEVEVNRHIVGQIGRGLLAYVAIAPRDTPREAETLAQKIVELRIFSDPQDKLNLSVRDIGGGVLAISNFTLLADARKGRRPSFEHAAPAPVAQPLHEAFLAALRTHGIPVAASVFGADMTIRSAADGPVNIVLDI